MKELTDLRTELEAQLQDCPIPAERVMAVGTNGLFIELVFSTEDNQTHKWVFPACNDHELDNNGELQ